MRGDQEQWKIIKEKYRVGKRREEKRREERNREEKRREEKKEERKSSGKLYLLNYKQENRQKAINGQDYTAVEKQSS